MALANVLGRAEAGADAVAADAAGASVRSSRRSVAEVEFVAGFAGSWVVAGSLPPFCFRNRSIVGETVEGNALVFWSGAGGGPILSNVFEWPALRAASGELMGEPDGRSRPGAVGEALRGAAGEV